MAEICGKKFSYCVCCHPKGHGWACVCSCGIRWEEQAGEYFSHPATDLKPRDPAACYVEGVGDPVLRERAEPATVLIPVEAGWNNMITTAAGPFTWKVSNIVQWSNLNDTLAMGDQNAANPN